MSTTQTEAEFLASYDLRKYPPAAVTADVALFTVVADDLCILLVQRAGHPFRGCWALPGGFVSQHESADAAARRELMEEATLGVAPAHLEQLGTYSEPGRDPRGHIVSVAYVGMLPDLPHPQAGSDASHACFWPLRKVFGEDGLQLAFDHDQIILDALARVQAKLEYTTLATKFVAGTFTMADLRRVYESVWFALDAGKQLHPSNFKRKVLAAEGFVVATGERTPARRGPQVDLYTAGPGRTLHPPILRFS